MRKKNLYLYALSIVFLLGCALGAGAVLVFDSRPAAFDSKFADVRQSAAQGSRLTNPLLECRELPETISIGERIGLQGKVERLIEEGKREGKVSEAAVYFRDLNNGPWFGVNESEKFSPASLLKIPLAISFFKQIESQPDILLRQIQYEKGTEKYELNQPFRPVQELENEKMYSTEELINIMLVDSSNEAALVLSQLAGEKQIEDTYRDFGQEVPVFGKDMEIDVRTFASFFRILFNATYLDILSSEQMLSMLTQTTFKEGIAAGVPAGVVVAHKFGSREIIGQAGSKQLHDCGIVYIPETPYIVCVMTQGDDFNELASFIKEISVLVYEEVGM
ncbi:MAG: serine hydrolase [Patescibacteria group bacterium]